MNIAGVTKKIVAILLLSCVASISHAAIVASAATGTSFTSGNIGSFNLNLPSSVNANDLLFAQITVNGNINVTAPSGWTLVLDNTQGSGNSIIRQFIYYHVAVAGDTANGATAWTLANNTAVAASMTGYRSNTSGQVAALGASVATTGSGTAMAAPAMTASAAGQLLRFYGHRSTNSLSSATLTTYVSVAASSSVTLLTGSRAISAGTTTTDTVTASSSANYIIDSILLSEITAKPSTCYSDTFASASTFSQNWVTASVGTNAFTPVILNGRLRLTDNTGYESTAATLQRLFPTGNTVYVEFNHYAYNGSGADGIAVTLSDATITPQPGGFGGSLGYAQRSDSGGINGFAGGWMGTALDEYGNYSNPTEGRNGGPGSRVDAVAIRGSGSGQTGYPYVAGTATLSPGIDNSGSTTAAPGYRYRIIVDAVNAGQTLVSVDRDTTGTGASYTNIIPTFNIQSASGQAAIPANLMLTFTGSSGGSTNIHEIGNLSVCATTINNVNQVDHFEFIHDGQGLTCEPESVTVRACADAACSTLMAVPVSVTLNPSAGWVGGNTQTINGSAVLQLRQTSAGTAAISVANSTPGTKPFSTNKCNGVSTNTCNLPFVDAGLEFDVPNLLANKPSGAVRFRAVKNSGDATNSCVALFQNTTQNINFWSTYTTPNSGARAVELRAGSGTFTSISGSSATPTALNLNFDANGETTFEARYQDAGLMALNARYNGSGTYAGLILNGSDSFVATPAGFCVRGATTSAPTTYLTCPSNYANCPVFATAGNPFALNIAAAAWESDSDSDFCTGNGDTPNYVQNALALSSQVIAPIATPTQFNGVVSPTTTSITANSNVTIANATESEVGAFTFMVAPPANAYFGVTVPSGTSATIGRFIPHHFSLVAGSTLVNRATSCAVAPAFTYLGETLNLGYQLNALNTSNVLTQNYQGAFARLSTFAQMNTAAISTSPRTALAPISSPSGSNLFNVTWTNGQGAVTSPVAISKTITPVGPYLSTAFGVAPTDSDSVATSGFNLDTDAPADSANEHVQIGSATELRYGRLRLDSVSGPANMPLSIPVTAEYWNDSTFVANTADSSCTTINSSLATLGNYRGSLNSGETSLSGSGTIVSGQTQNALTLSAPGTGNEGSVEVTLDVSSWPWLEFDWNGDGTFDTNATATASFGTYRGSDRVIYWQETQ